MSLVCISIFGYLFVMDVEQKRLEQEDEAFITAIAKIESTSYQKLDELLWDVYGDKSLPPSDRALLNQKNKTLKKQLSKWEQPVLDKTLQNKSWITRRTAQEMKYMAVYAEMKDRSEKIEELLKYQDRYVVEKIGTELIQTF